MISCLTVIEVNSFSLTVPFNLKACLIDLEEQCQKPSLARQNVNSWPRLSMHRPSTIEKVVKLIGQAGSESIDLLVFPETFIPGYPVRQIFSLQHSSLIRPCAVLYRMLSTFEPSHSSCRVRRTKRRDIIFILAACRKHNVAISLGVSERAHDGYTLFNAQINIDSDGAILGVHRKLQPTYVERAVWAQGSGHTLRTYTTRAGYKLGGLCCWENTMNGARQALLQQGQEFHAGAWPALSTMAGFESGANAQIEALMKNHALTGQVFVVCAANFIVLCTAAVCKSIM